MDDEGPLTGQREKVAPRTNNRRLTSTLVSQPIYSPKFTQAMEITTRYYLSLVETFFLPYLIMDTFNI